MAQFRDHGFPDSAEQRCVGDAVVTPSRERRRLVDDDPTVGACVPSSSASFHRCCCTRVQSLKGRSDMLRCAGSSLRCPCLRSTPLTRRPRAHPVDTWSRRRSGRLNRPETSVPTGATQHGPITCGPRSTRHRSEPGPVRAHVPRSNAHEPGARHDSRTRPYVRRPGEETLEDLGNVLAMSAGDVGRLVGWEQLRLGGVG